MNGLSYQLTLWIIPDRHWRRNGPRRQSIGGAEHCSRTMACPSNALIVFVRRSGASADSYCVILGRFRMYPQHDTRCECVFVPWGRALALLLDTQWKKSYTHWIKWSFGLDYFNWIEFNVLLPYVLISGIGYTYQNERGHSFAVWIMSDSAILGYTVGLRIHSFINPG